MAELQNNILKIKLDTYKDTNPYKYLSIPIDRFILETNDDNNELLIFTGDNFESNFRVCFEGNEKEYLEVKALLFKGGGNPTFASIGG